MRLKKYNEKRDFSKTDEPEGKKDLSFNFIGQGATTMISGLSITAFLSAGPFQKGFQKTIKTSALLSRSRTIRLTISALKVAFQKGSMVQARLRFGTTAFISANRHCPKV